MAVMHRDKSSEVDALIRCHGLEFDDACRLVVILPSEYVPGSPALEWLPTPEIIERMKPARR